jgi:hypothetical protein
MRFLAPVEPATWLYYGNPQATRPDYDLRLVSARLMVADTGVVALGKEEGLRGSGVWHERVFSSGGTWLFWVALASVVVGLLWVMRRLVPANDPSAGSPG